MLNSKSGLKLSFGNPFGNSVIVTFCSCFLQASLARAFGTGLSSGVMPLEDAY